jgi:hypothetical protein
VCSGSLLLSSKTCLVFSTRFSFSYSLFPIHVLCVLTMVSRRRSLQYQARDPETKKVRRRLLASASALNDVARRESMRDGNRVRRRVFRRRHRAGRDPSRDSPPSTFLPPHQRHALDDFLDRVLSVRTEFHECAICSERYYGMKMHTDSCDRCHREVRFRVVVFPSRSSLTEIRTSIRFHKQRRSRSDSDCTSSCILWSHTDQGDAVLARLTVFSHVGQQRRSVQDTGQRHHVFPRHLVCVRLFHVCLKSWTC